MSHSRRKLQNTVLNDFPTPGVEEAIVRVTELRGSNQAEVERIDGSRLLVQIPTRFRKLIWIRRGNFLIVREPAGLAALENVRVKALVQNVLFGPQVAHLRKAGLWPAQFSDGEGERSLDENSSGGIDRDLLPPSDSDEDEPFTVANPNRLQMPAEED